MYIAPSDHQEMYNILYIPGLFYWLYIVCATFYSHGPIDNAVCLLCVADFIEHEGI